jgi:hypothetical protein
MKNAKGEGKGTFGVTRPTCDRVDRGELMVASEMNFTCSSFKCSAGGPLYLLFTFSLPNSFLEGKVVGGTRARDTF